MPISSRPVERRRRSIVKHVIARLAMRAMTSQESDALFRRTCTFSHIHGVLTCLPIWQCQTHLPFVLVWQALSLSQSVSWWQDGPGSAPATALSVGRLSLSLQRSAVVTVRYYSSKSAATDYVLQWRHLVHIGMIACGVVRYLQHRIRVYMRTC